MKCISFIIFTSPCVCGKVGADPPLVPQALMSTPSAAAASGLGADEDYSLLLLERALLATNANSLTGTRKRLDDALVRISVMEPPPVTHKGTTRLGCLWAV